MRIHVISFTEQGKKLGDKIKSVCHPVFETEVYYKPEGGVMKWAADHFRQSHALVFIGACGIAVRAIAPLVKDKLTDSAVVVIDEKGKFVIPILSGHVGGANELAGELAKRIGGTAVITTATDVNRKPSIDVFAVKNHFRILNKEAIKFVSRKVLAGEKISISVQEKVEEPEKLPDNLSWIPYPPKEKVDVIVSKDEVELKKGLLKLRPAQYVLGIGCKEGKRAEELSRFAEKVLTKQGLQWTDISLIASVDRKKDEKGILELAEEKKIEFKTFSSEELARVPGKFQSSEFVRAMVGVDNVCERAAVAGCGSGGELVVSKQAKDGKTLALAKRKDEIIWKEWMEDGK